MPNTEDWDLWYPQAGATGLPFARGRMAAGVETLLVHAAPPMLSITIRDAAGRPLANGVDLAAGADTPIARLTRRGDHVEREDIWPDHGEIGRLVLLPGGEVGTLTSWWHADDHSSWRWSIELYNHR